MDNQPNFFITPLEPLMPSDGLCQHCRVRRATLDWVGEGGTLGHVHGLYERWCEVCATTEQLAYAKRQAARVPELEAKLLATLADPPSPAGTR